MPLVGRVLPMAIALVCGLVAAAIYYIPHGWAQELERELALWLRIVAAFAYFLGLYSLLKLHWGRIASRQAGWGYSLVVYAGFGLMLSFVVFNRGNGPLAPQASGGGYQWLFDHVHVPCASTMFSLLAFFIASAAYRTFRARTPEAAVLLVAAVITMLGRVPVGRAISGFLPEASEWLMAVPNLAAKRGIMLGVCLAAVATSLRIIFGIERSYLGGESK